MPDLRRSQDAVADSDHRAAADLLPVVYDELRKLAAVKMANERPDHTLDATALVHEAFLKLGGEQSFASKSAFLRSAAVAMRRILVDHARARQADKRGGPDKRIDLNDADLNVVVDPDTVLTIDEILTTLAMDDPIAAELARLRLFAGSSIEDAAKALDISRAEGFRNWNYARAVLSAGLMDQNNSRNS